MREYWESVGNSEPFWGVLTHSEYKSQKELSPLAEQNFFASGSRDVQFIAEVLHDHAGTDLSTLGQGATFLDLGCGVGRLAVHMARHCSHVVCVDIAASYLELLSTTCARRGVGNFSVATLDALLAPSFALPAACADAPLRLVYSLITLQHNPPALALALVDRLCALLAPGGFAVLQCPHRIADHTLKDFPDVMQMNFVPQQQVIERARASGCELVAALDEGVDFCGGGGIEDCVYVLRKAAAQG